MYAIRSYYAQRIKMLNEYAELHQRMGGPGASDKAAKLMQEALGIV